MDRIGKILRAEDIKKKRKGKASQIKRALKMKISNFQSSKTKRKKQGDRNSL